VGIRRRVELVATAYADELSTRSLADITAITADQNVRIIGGQMASLLLTAFPVPGIAGRRTNARELSVLVWCDPIDVDLRCGCGV
jgi:hypothetical protein